MSQRGISVKSVTVENVGGELIIQNLDNRYPLRGVKIELFFIAEQN